MRLGVLDVGSNTVHLLVVDAHRGAHPWPAYSEKATPRLAEKIGSDGRLSKAGADALVEAVAKARDAAASYQTEDLLAFATSAVRDATNSTAVLRRVRDETGVDLQVLSGEAEAIMTFLAVRRWFGWSAGRLLVLDIGGGSLEMAAGIDEEPGTALSLPLGAGRLTRHRLGPSGGHLQDLPHAGPPYRCGAVRRGTEGGAPALASRAASGDRVHPPDALGRARRDGGGQSRPGPPGARRGGRRRGGHAPARHRHPGLLPVGAPRGRDPAPPRRAGVSLSRERSTTAG